MGESVKAEQLQYGAKEVCKPGELGLLAACRSSWVLGETTKPGLSVSSFIVIISISQKTQIMKPC